MTPVALPAPSVIVAHEGVRVHPLVVDEAHGRAMNLVSAGFQHEIEYPATRPTVFSAHPGSLDFDLLESLQRRARFTELAADIDRRIGAIQHDPLGKRRTTVDAALPVVAAHARCQFVSEILRKP